MAGLLFVPRIERSCRAHLDNSLLNSLVRDPARHASGLLKRDATIHEVKPRRGQAAPAKARPADGEGELDGGQLSPRSRSIASTPCLVISKCMDSSVRRARGG